MWEVCSDARSSKQKKNAMTRTIIFPTFTALLRLKIMLETHLYPLLHE